MKRYLIGAALVAGLVLGASPAHAADQHQARHKHSCATQCRPPKTPPPGGWPCRLDKSCASKHHYKPCPKPKPTPPPVTVTPRPPKLTHHTPKPRTPQHIPAAPVAHTAQLPRTGGLYGPGLAGLVLIPGGGLLIAAGRKKGEQR